VKKILISIVFCFGLFATQRHAHAQNVNPATQIKWPTDCSTSGTLYSPSGNQCINVSGISTGPVVYPAQCQQSGAPSWCGGTGLTADAYIRAACGTLPSTGGVINFAGLTGNLAASVTCSNPTKQVIMYADPTSSLIVTEADGGIVFPLDEYSMLLGPGNGACIPSKGIHLSSSTNITAVVGPAHVDGTQESFTANGLCILGAVGATVTKGLIYANQIFTNTSISFNNLFECNNACVWLQDVGGEISVSGNWMGVGEGIAGVNGSDLVITGVVQGSSDVSVFANTMEHANGGAAFPEVSISGNGSGGSSTGINLSDNYIERIGNSPYVPDVNAISITDCQGCSVTNTRGQGTTGGTNFILVSETAPGRTANVLVENITATSWTNVLDDTITGLSFQEAIHYTLDHYVVQAGYSDAPCSPLPSTPGAPYIGECWSDPTDYRTDINTQSGLQQFAWLSDVATLPHSVGADVMNGAGNFSTGSSSFGTNFVASGCQTIQGLTCTYSRTNSTAPPGSTFSQEVTISTNTDPNIGFNGIQYSPSVSFTAGQSYLVNFWAKGDGSFAGTPTFLLATIATPTFYCQSGSNLPLTTSWQLFSFVCVPAVSGSSNIAVVATTPLGAVGSFWIGDFTFTPETTLTPGNFTGAIGPYGIGTSVNGASIGVGTGAPTSTCGTAPTGNGSLWLRTDGTASTTLYVCAASSWTAVTVP
jgi:hypothetical protein